MPLPRSALGLAFACLLAPLVACTGAEGDPCQEQDDCNSGLFCCKTSPGLSSRGVCLEEGATCEDTTPVDSGPPPADSGTPETDAGPEDAGTDAGMDAGAAEDAGTDAGTDAGAAEDAGTDAG